MNHPYRTNDALLANSLACVATKASAMIPGGSVFFDDIASLRRARTAGAVAIPLAAQPSNRV